MTSTSSTLVNLLHQAGQAVGGGVVWGQEGVAGQAHTIGLVLMQTLMMRTTTHGQPGELGERLEEQHEAEQGAGELSYALAHQALTMQFCTRQAYHGHAI